MTLARCLSPESLKLRQTLVQLGRRYDAKGWLLGTCGNLSARFSPERVVVTASGRHKGILTVDDFVELDLDGQLLAAPPGSTASAEGSVHLALYRRVPQATVTLHVHTVASTLCRADIPGSAAPTGWPARARFTGLEMLKGWGLWGDGAVAELPIFPNHHAVPAIAAEIDRWYGRDPATRNDSSPQVPALLIAGHGITAWGDTAFSASRHLEVTEFLCQLRLASSRSGSEV